MTRLLGILIAFALLGLGTVGARSVRRAQEASAHAESLRLVNDAAVRATDALTAHRATAEAKVLGAASNPRLAAAVGGGVDARTLRDLLDNETWWERHRQEFPIHALLLRGNKRPLYARGDFGDFDADALIAEVRATAAPRAAILPGRKEAYLVALAIVEAPSRVDSPLLLLARPLAGEIMNAIAARARGAVLLTDSSRPLTTAGAEARVGLLRSAVGRERPGDGVFMSPDGTWSAVARPVGPGLRLWVFADTSASAAASRRVAARNQALVWAAGALLALGVLIFAFRRRRQATPAVVAPVPPARSGRILTAPQGVPVPVGSSDTTRAVSAGTATTMGRYLLLDRIGEGGMAEVFTAVTFGVEGFRRRFVIKRLRADLAGNPQAVSQFIDEANLGSNLFHPNIVPVFDFGSTGTAYFLTQEYVPGRDLGQVVRRLLRERRQALTPDLVLWIASEVLQALDYAHNKRAPEGDPLGIVHRDVTPENVMLSERGEVKLLDFGVVKANHGRMAQTEVGLVKGSVGFMAPEQARGRDVDARADLFSLGLLMYYALTGRTLYEGGSSYDLLVRAANGPGAAELTLLAGLPAPCDELISRAVASSPAERYQTAVEFRAAIVPHLQPREPVLQALIGELFGADLEAERRRIDAALPSGVVADELPAAATSVH